MNASIARQLRRGIRAARDDTRGAQLNARPLRGRREWKAYWRTIYALMTAHKVQLAHERLVRLKTDKR